MVGSLQKGKTNKTKAWNISPFVECLSSMYEAMVLPPCTEKKLPINYTSTRYSIWKTENKGKNDYLSLP